MSKMCHLPYVYCTYLEVLIYQEPDYLSKIENKSKNGKIEVNKSVIPTNVIHHLSYSFKQSNKF